ncbi:hypothetical protein BASA50_004989 [Batrachochytrium salamandrivorans]|uniref:CRAL-TRIO domain-containing protein n=1 Tax=Batrachochytrium salamandrivorans TaxID=1357716 RepID=A0ABQ8FEH5_9FUNG|nr:hypothetical protein BASA61_004782 [Batrachochytrium salamandrivorans]KAH6596658.1 hypothetical protein BASA50_004989 [Batrachochytrium salamandrivorans]KAH9248551.1 hypothetical protein BASA81_013735 [Batrachochytrium salamandrivorans]KAH9270455.1 hypothetical protein BASA83_007455 [Batrachochytrium salamandrivorans]KAJ1344103.1 hypothetical protein BSLG_001243 [Batrachochytrium salamandrivorans]
MLLTPPRDECLLAFKQHGPAIAELQHFLLDSITTNRSSLNLSPHEMAHFAELILDKASLLRFFKKYKLSLASTQAALVVHIDWRLTHNLPQLCFETLSPRAIEYLQQGLFRFWKTDLKGMPVLHITPRYFLPSVDGTELEDLRLCVIFVLEVCRRWIHSLNKNDPSITPASVAPAITSSTISTYDSDPDPTHFQSTVVVDLKGFGMSNMNYELLPLFLEIFQKHFPQIIGHVLVLNYGWIHAGIWSIIKAGLTADATERLQFISSNELCNFIPTSHIPIEFGGSDSMLPSSPWICPIIMSFGSTVPPIHQTRDHEHLMNRFLYSDDMPDDCCDEDVIYMTSSKSSASVTSDYAGVPDVWHDAQSMFSGVSFSTNVTGPFDSSKSYPPISVRSAADLQMLLRVQEYRSGLGLYRTPSAKSLTSLTTKRLLSISDGSQLHDMRHPGHFFSPLVNEMPPQPNTSDLSFSAPTYISTAPRTHDPLEDSSQSSPDKPIKKRYWIPLFFSSIFGHRRRFHQYHSRPQLYDVLASTSKTGSQSPKSVDLLKVTPESDVADASSPSSERSWLRVGVWMHAYCGNHWRILLLFLVSAFLARRILTSRTYLHS